MSFLEQLDRDAVGRLDEGHVPVARRAVDGVPCIQQALAGRVDIVHPVGEVAEIAPATIFLRGAAVLGRPVIGEFDLGKAFLPGRGKEDQREAPGLAVEPPHLLETDQREKGDRRIRIGDTDHAVEILDHERDHATTHAELQPPNTPSRQLPRTATGPVPLPGHPAIN